MDKEIIIREILPADNSALAAVIRATFIEHNAPTTGTVYSDPTTDNLFDFFKEKGSKLFIAEKQGKILGSCGIYPTNGLPEGCVELVKFYLAPAARGKGIGKTLVEKSLNTARILGYTSMYIESLPQFAKAVSMYEKQGFERLSSPLGNSGHTSCDVWMVKEL